MFHALFKMHTDPSYPANEENTERYLKISWVGGR